MADLKKTIAQNLSALRKGMHLTQAELAEKINYTDKAISKWERGESIPDIETLKKIADLFGVSLDYLVEEEHASMQKKERPNSRTVNNHIAITLLAVAGVWLVATILYFFLNIREYTDTWKLYLGAVPLSFIILLIFNSIWGRKIYKFFILTALVWTLLLFAYIMMLAHNLVIIFSIGIPLQVMIILWSRLKAK